MWMQPSRGGALAKELTVVAKMRSLCPVGPQRRVHCHGGPVQWWPRWLYRNRSLSTLKLRDGALHMEGRSHRHDDFAQDSEHDRLTKVTFRPTNGNPI